MKEGTIERIISPGRKRLDDLSDAKTCQDEDSDFSHREHSNKDVPPR